MEEMVRYLIIGLGIAYTVYKIKSITWDKKYGCDTCNMKNSCNKKECKTDNVDLTVLEKEKIKKIKLAYKN